MSTHPRRALIEPLLASLEGLRVAGVVRTVAEAPVHAIEAKGGAPAFPAVAVNPKDEAASEDGASYVRTLSVAVVVGARTLAEADNVAADVEDLVDALGRWVLRSTEFGYDAEAERPFFFVRLLYACAYATTKATQGAQP